MIDKNRYRIRNAYISITNPEDAIHKIEEAVEKRLNTYICVSNFRMVRFANHDKSYNEVMKYSYMNLPDGMPLVWCGKLWGIEKVQRTSGPDLFDAMLKRPDNSIKHFLLGDTEETLAAIVKKYKSEFNANIVGTFSPPFTGVDDFDFSAIADIINKSEANIVWVSMRAPKQDIFSTKILPLLNKPAVCIGVGRAFRISIGTVKNAPKVVQRLGISGLFNRRTSLFKELIWYFSNSFFLMFYIVHILVLRVLNRN